MSGQRRNSQLHLAFPEERGGEASKDSGEGTEPPAAMTNLASNQPNRRGTRPVRPVVWEGGSREASPYPDFDRDVPRKPHC